MAKKDTNVSTMINNQLTNVQTTFVSFENFLRVASTADATPDTLKALERRIYEEEGKADEALRAMIDSLVTEILLPSTKKEMIDIGTSCDKIANKCESVATTMVLQGLRIPQAYAEDVMKIVEITEQHFSILCNVINTLFANFKSLLKDHSILDQIRALESEVDALEHGIYERIFAGEGDVGSKMQAAGIVGSICDISDIIENIADQIQIMLITRKV